MTRKLFFVALLTMLAPLTLASPTPNVTFVIHNKTGTTLTNCWAYTHFDQGHGGFSGAADLTFGTIAPGAAPSKSFGMVFPQFSMTHTIVIVYANGRKEDMRINGFWNKWQHREGQAYKYLMTWTDYRVDFYLEKP